MFCCLILMSSHTPTAGTSFFDCFTHRDFWENDVLLPSTHQQRFFFHPAPGFMMTRDSITRPTAWWIYVCPGRLFKTSDVGPLGWPLGWPQGPLQGPPKRFQWPEVRLQICFVEVHKINQIQSRSVSTGYVYHISSPNIDYW